LDLSFKWADSVPNRDKRLELKLCGRDSRTERSFEAGAPRQWAINKRATVITVTTSALSMTMSIMPKTPECRSFTGAMEVRIQPPFAGKTLKVARFMLDR